MDQIPDILKSAARACKLPRENERVRVLGILLEPGEKAPVHTHPDDHVVYVMKNTGFRLMFANSRSRNHSPETLPSGQPEG
jgi:predicted metal-dependent enzyme (double-stranded beta helix superfamily)